VALAKLLLVACAAFSGPPGEGEGVIGGLVVNASRENAPVGGADVVLRVELDGRFVPFRQTTADAQGRFLFDKLPVGRQYLYLPGANRDDIHYPGPRMQLSPQRPRINVELAVRDALSRPNPLLIRRHEIVIRPEPGALSVSESLLVENPTSTCYVGQAVDKGATPVTLQLAVPGDFERVTFAEEFFGRRFLIAGGKLLTGMPWQPGQRELKFSYVLPNRQRYRVWQRPLDLPCSQVRICVQTADPQEVSCNLERAGDGANGEVVFQSAGRDLSAGFIVRVELGHLPVPLMAYARWLALLILGGLMLATGWRWRLASAEPRHGQDARATRGNKPSP
jgi:hypothetical protein